MMFLEGERAMRTGMLWFDNNDQHDMEAKLRRAVDYYEKKYGKRPSVCVVHPLTMAGNKKDRLGLDIRVEQRAATPLLAREEQSTKKAHDRQPDRAAGLHNAVRRSLAARPATAAQYSRRPPTAR